MQVEMTVSVASFIVQCTLTVTSFCSMAGPSTALPESDDEFSEELDELSLADSACTMFGMPAALSESCSPPSNL